MIKLIQGNILLEMDPVSENKNGVWVILKDKASKYKGKVIQVAKGSKFKIGDCVRVVPRYILLENKEGKLTRCLIKENLVVITFKKNKMIVHGDRILVEPVYDLVKDEEGVAKLTENIIAADTMIKAQKPQKGKIVEIGDDEKCSKYKKNDVVLFMKSAGNEVDVEGVKYILLRFSEILITL